MSGFIIKFWGDLAGQPGSVVVEEGCQEAEVPGSILGAYTYRFSFFFNLVEKNSFTVKKFSKCRENGIDRLRNGNLRRRCHQIMNQSELPEVASWAGITRGMNSVYNAVQYGRAKCG